MPRFGRRSTKQLDGCDGRLVEVCGIVIVHFDFSVLVGHRGREAQEAAFLGGYSKVRWPDSDHNEIPSKAVDVAPYPIDWSDAARFTYLAGWIMSTAASLGLTLQWGGDWDRDTQVKDETFRDFGHFGIVDLC